LKCCIWHINAVRRNNCGFDRHRYNSQRGKWSYPKLILRRGSSCAVRNPRKMVMLKNDLTVKQ
jgi:hypothetical protein